jgi:hypothetical protein
LMISKIKKKLSILLLTIFAYVLIPGKNNLEAKHFD